ncbi:hypothetical protein Tco_0894440 [Tanacetum coccineum]|uniref:Reverse transcriptase Ty1/copia-type domain-containing protein n=1 Tax=Tanacetum coccineum TaxID=301880 RepID=A0ABQ5CD23_9ASTR
MARGNRCKEQSKVVLHSDTDKRRVIDYRGICPVAKLRAIKTVLGFLLRYGSFLMTSYLGSTNKPGGDDFEVLMKGELKMMLWEDELLLRSTVKPLTDVSLYQTQVTPLTSHLNAVKKIFKYLKGQPKLGLWYPKDSPFQLEAYSDSDYAGPWDRNLQVSSFDHHQY